MSDFVHLHLHLHTTYSLLDGQCQIKPLVAKAKELGMSALAVTDHGNLFALKAFHVGAGAIVFTSISQGTFDEKEINLRHNRRRAQGLLTRLVANLGGAVDDTFLKGTGAKLYADKPEMNDDPYRYYRW